MPTPETIPSWAIWVPAISAAIGGIIAVAGNTINNVINKRYEERRHLKDVIVKTASDSHKEHLELVKKRGGGIFPIESYIFHMAILSDILLDPDEISEEEVLNRLRKSNSIRRAHEKFDKEVRENMKKESALNNGIKADS